MTAPTPEDVARNTGGWNTDTADAVERFVNRVKRSKAGQTIRKFFVPVEEGEAVVAALRAARAAAIEEAVPPGYVVVPKEPTEAMLEAVAPFPEHLAEEHRDDPEWRTQMTAATVADQMVARQTYRDMVEAAIRALGEESAAPREEESAAR